ncbi:MAG: GLUG motif-containing protein [Alloprevotella sp.]|nr:GLUG motif-containing protein [Alloprevotella sp.]
MVSDGNNFSEWTPIGRGDFSYNGIFNGQGHTISGLYFKLNNPYDSKGNYVGFFGCTGRNSKISNVGIVDSYFCGLNYVGGVCGHHSYGEISNCYSASTVSGSASVGGVCGHHSYGEISNCYSAGAVSATSNFVGGVCGTNSSGSTISNCYFDSKKCDKNAIGLNYGTATNTKGKTTAQFASGEVCYLLNGSKSDGTQAWYQNLTLQTGDKHPVLTNSGNNTVYDAPLLCGGINNVGNTYANTETVSIEHILIGEPSFNEEKAIYQKICQREGCGATCYFADSKGLYATKEEAGAFTANTYVLQDATTYDNRAVFTVNDFTYARTFEDTGWTTWYVPFNLLLTEELCNTYSFSRINNVHRYDDNDDGTPDRTEVEAFNQLAGVTLKANYPYLVKAKTDGNLHMALLLNGVTPAKAEDNGCFCQSVDYKYSFTGTYSGLSEVGTGSEDPYSLQSNGEWTHQSEISPMRHYLTVTSRNAAPLSSLARISLVVIGDETLTGTVIPYSQEKRQTETYDLSGRLTHSNQRGIVIRNGKKIIQK